MQDELLPCTLVDRRNRDGDTYGGDVSHFDHVQSLNSMYTLNCAGGHVVHSYGRLIPHEFAITDLQQISGPDGIGRITCTVSSGTAGFVLNSGNRLETGGVSQTRNGATATLVVNPPNVDSFQNRALYCTNFTTNFFYLYISSASKFRHYYYIVYTHKTTVYIIQSKIMRMYLTDNHSYTQTWQINICNTKTSACLQKNNFA